METASKEEFTPETTPDFVVKDKPSKKRDMAKYFATIIGADNHFDCVLSANNKAELSAMIAVHAAKCDEAGIGYIITQIVKGHEVRFHEKKSIEFL
jgi:hypothetical protein